MTRPPRPALRKVLGPVAVAALALLGVIGCSGGSTADGAGVADMSSGPCAASSGEAVELAQRLLDDATDEDPTLSDPAHQDAMMTLTARAHDEGCIESSADFASLVCPRVDELTAAGDTAQARLAELAEECTWSPDPAAARHPSLTTCEPAADAPPAYPIPQTEFHSLFTDVVDPFLAQGFRFAEQRIEFRDALSHHVTLNIAGDGAVQGLTRITEGGATTWDEFHWEDPMWSTRSESEPWSTREESGAFEPPHRVAFTWPVSSATAIAGSPLLEPVFERSIENGSVDLLQYCMASAGGLSSVSPGRLSRTRFVAHPDGYVVEYVEATVGSAGRSCYESTLDIGGDIEVPGPVESLPPDEVVTLSALQGCADLVDD